MNRQFTIYRRLTTTETPQVVFDAVEQSLRTSVGGSVVREGNTFRVFNGSKNLNFAFVADVNAEIVLTQPTPGVINLNGTITITPNAFFWIMAITGAFCLWFLWGFNILYFVMDPRANYQLALDRVRFDDPSANGDPAYRS